VLPLWGTYFGPPGAFVGMDVDVSVSETAERGGSATRAE